jgi:3-oxoacyl-[acyl-carrier-protein] synthase II
MPALMGKRVVITGVGLISPLGNSLDAVTQALIAGDHGIASVDAWQRYDIETKVGGIAQPFEVRGCSRKQLRAMGPVAQMAVAATQAAIADAGLDDVIVRDPDTALFYGSTDGSTRAAVDYYRKLYTTDRFSGLLASSYLKFMSHTCAANIAQALGVRGRVVPICSACTSASQSIGEAYYGIRSGREQVALCGGAEELHFTVAGVFDLMLAASVRYNERPDSTPRPFDRDRDGLVVAEGAGTLVLEEYEHARGRDARIYAEVLGYGSSCDGQHLTSPSPEGMATAMRKALASAGIRSDDIDYINAHATGTEVGDIAESEATLAALGECATKIPISSTKGHTGHTLGACGAIESAFVLGMMREQFVVPTRNLDHVDPRCAPLSFVVGDARPARVDRAMSNNFAFGGINTSLIFGRV